MKTDPTLSGPLASATPGAGSQRRLGRAVRLAAAAVAGAALLGAGAAGCSSPQASGPVVIDKEALPLSCATGGGAFGTCVVGDTGPGGGKVFYVNPTDSPGSNYMEAVVAGMTPAWDDFDSGSYYPWCVGAGQTAKVTTGTAIGAGKTNTDNMVAACTSGAANSVRAYTGGGLAAGSWSLPSLGELNELDVSGVGGLLDFGFYWSSSQVDALDALGQGVGIGGDVDRQVPDDKSDGNPVRPVRAF